MNVIAGLPAHALLVHAIVVLAPLTALLGILCAVWPAARRRFVWLVLVLSAVNLALTPLTASAGQWLYDRSSAHSPALETHAERGATMIYLSIALLAMAIVLALHHVRSANSDAPRTASAVVVAVIALAVGVSAIAGVMRIGHSGTEAKWGIITE
ncbi:DUF2231 domain-containing protein [Mycolicibacterium sp.]|uniref:DUF2231 domain-containing protein n=1 Tax=Mycolicibacterium sp. TaxID=2320850 RepID=UPI003D0D540F